MELALFQVDAFTSKVFGGNPAAICPLPEWLPDETLQNIAQENNLAETAFFVQTGDRYHLRWFTPEVEMDLCGHATLASAHVLFTHFLPSAGRVAFDTRSGELTVVRDGDRLKMDLPARPPQRVPVHPQLIPGLGATPTEVLAARDYLCVFAREADVAALRPNFNALLAVDRMVIVTAPGDHSDFVSRFFAPTSGVPEDPVTGSAHCTLVPYWASRLAKHELFARQISRRVGELWCRLEGDRVQLSGYAVEYLRGTIQV
jgi:predicted PhzF superfamily epimerase YddE/YHI9